MSFNIIPPPPGKGTASIAPPLAQGALSQTLTVIVHGQASYTLTNTNVVVPPIFTWSHSTGDISLTGGGSPSLTISGDTVKISSMTVAAADSIQIAINNITPPDSTDTFIFHTQTGTQPDSILDLPAQPGVLVYGTPHSIGDIKTNDVNGIPVWQGRWVTILGVVTVGAEFGSPSYIQDVTGGIAVYGVITSSEIAIGDEVEIVGLISPFNGLSELNSPTLIKKVSSGNVVTPVLVNCGQVYHDGAGGVEQYEGRLVRINQVTVTNLADGAIASWAVGPSGTNYRLHNAADPADSVQIRVDNNVNFANTPSPQSSFDVIGVVSQFKSASPFIGGYQLMPRSTADILSQGPIFATLPVESNITQSSFRISWTTVNNGTSRLRYGTTTAYELGVIEPDNTLRTSHAIDIMGLQAATIYHVEAFSVLTPDSSTAGDLVVSTASPAGSTGQMNVYFNKSVNTSVSMGENALGNEDLVSRIVTRINNAQRSIDLALYSLSASGQGDVIASALISAKNRGVKVRVICEYDNSTSGGSSFPTLVSSGIPLITDRFDAVWFGAGLSHNKFFVIDYRGGAPESVWVWTGSWNPTFDGTASQRQNSIEIQDVALAGAYTTEFNEMWGSNTDTPNSSTSRFGARKADNTPHHFVINGVPVSSYFSPSDDASKQIRETIGHAQHSVGACILTFTRKDIADSIIAKKTAGDKTRVVVDNNTDTGAQYSYLQTNGVDIHLKGGSGLLHHKYVVVDGDQVVGTQYVETGSHNWSNAAENSNDENTLVVQNRRVANLYLQEFAARYYEAGGTDSIHIADSPIYSQSRSTINFDTVTIGDSKQDSFTVSNTGTSSLTITNASTGTAYYSVTPSSATVAPSATQKFYVTFTPTLTGIRTDSVTLTHNAPGSPNVVSLSGVGKQAGLDTVTSYIGLMDGWNMVSVPVRVGDPRKTTLFPTATSLAFAYQAGYVPHDSMANGKGFWVKVSGAQTDSIKGIAINPETMSVAISWNMIGSITNPVAKTSIVQNPPSIVTSNYFEFNGAYVSVDTIKPGSAYWVKTNQAGTLVLASASQQPKPASLEPAKGLNTLVFSDAEGHEQTLYFGTDTKTDLHAGLFEVPPAPPEGAFDVRFAAGTSLGLYAKDLRNPAFLSIRLQAKNTPVKLRWSIDSQDANSYTLKAGTEQEAASIKLTGKGETSIAGSPATELLLVVSPVKLLPKEFSLGQNYPNPFNPSTTIPFALPHDATVTLTIYNVLGEVMQRVFDHELLESGYHDMTLNASQYSSGVYYYRLDAVGESQSRSGFSQTRKFLLLK